MAIAVDFVPFATGALPAPPVDRWATFVRHRDPRLREELVAQYTPLVRQVVHRLRVAPSGVADADDLVGAGMLGLVEAIDRFEPAAGVKFETFAFTRIRGAILDQARALDWVPRSVRQRGTAVAAAQERLTARYGRTPTAAETAADMGLDPAAFRAARAGAAPVLSLDAPQGGAGDGAGEPGAALAETVPGEGAPDPQRAAEDAELHGALVRGLRGLPERERLVLSLYYERELTMKEIGQVLGVSEPRVCQLHGRALQRLRSALPR